MSHTKFTGGCGEGEQIVVFVCTFKYFLDSSDQGSNYCGGDRVACHLLICLLNAALRQHRKERSAVLSPVGLCFAQTWKEQFPSFRMEHGELKHTAGERELPQHSRYQIRGKKGEVQTYVSHLLLIGKTRVEQALKTEALIKLSEYTSVSCIPFGVIFLHMHIFLLTQMFVPS